MKKTVNVTGAVILLLCIAVVTMAFGFAQYAQNLTISGTVTAKASKWDIHYIPDSYSLSANSVVASSSEIADENTSFKFAVQLTKPGDFYETTIKAKNYGSFAAKLSSVNLSALTEDQAKYLKYSVTVAGTEYTEATNNDLSVALAAGASHDVVIRVEYYQAADDEIGENLPTTDQTITVSGTLGYVQAEE